MVSMAPSANLASKLEPIAYNLSLPPHFFILSSPKATMRDPSTSTTTMATFKQSFLKNLLSSLKNSSNNKAMSTLSERRRAIKSSADIAMATARAGIAGATRWPQAILASSSSSSSSSSSLPRTTFPCKMMQGKVRRCKSIVRKTPLMSSSEVARRLVKKRTKVLRRMIPGGELIADEISLLHEAMDYVVHLHAQVDVLRRVSRTVARGSNAAAASSSSGGFAQLKERTVQISGETENPC